MYSGYSTLSGAQKTGVYEVYRDRTRQWRWRYKAVNGKIIADSAESYVNKEDCLRGIAIMKQSGHSPVREI